MIKFNPTEVKMLQALLDENPQGLSFLDEGVLDIIKNGVKHKIDTYIPPKKEIHETYLDKIKKWGLSNVYVSDNGFIKTDDRIYMWENFYLKDRSLKNLLQSLSENNAYVILKQPTKLDGLKKIRVVLIK